MRSNQLSYAPTMQRIIASKAGAGKSLCPIFHPRHPRLYREVRLAGAADRGVRASRRRGFQQKDWRVAGQSGHEEYSGGPEGIRTPDLYSAIVALSQLSYRPVTGRLHPSVSEL